LLEGILEVDELTGRPTLEDVKRATKFYLGKVIEFLSLKTNEPLRGWDHTKFHECLHLVLNMKLCGWASNYNASTGERPLKTKAKVPSCTVQKQNDETQFLLDGAKQVHETLVVEAAYCNLEMENRKAAQSTMDNKAYPTYGGTSLRVILTKEIGVEGESISPLLWNINTRWAQNGNTHGFNCQRSGKPWLLHIFKGT
jgi:hypothetical protein